MMEPERQPSSEQDPGDEAGIVLPSWIDAAIEKSRDEARASRAREFVVSEPELADTDLRHASESDVTPLLEDGDIDPENPSSRWKQDLVPSFLPSRAAPTFEPEPDTEVEPEEERRAAPAPILRRHDPVQAIPTEENAPIEFASDAPRRGAIAPWLFAALFFLAAAAVLAVLIWIRPPR